MADRSGPLALSLLAASRVADLPSAADEIRAVVHELLALPQIDANDLTAREVALALMVWHKTEAAKRLLAIVELKS